MPNWRREIRWLGASDGGRAPRTAAIPLAMGERGPQTRGPHEIAVVGGADFVGWEMPGRQMGRMGAEDPSVIWHQSSSSPGVCVVGCRPRAGTRLPPRCVLSIRVVG